jgi:hypothetical protein
MFFYDPESYEFLGMVRSSQSQEFQAITPLNFPWTSPMLGVRFEMFADGLALFYPTGEPFNDPDIILEDCDQLAQERDQLAQERDRAFAKLRELGFNPSDL